MYELLMLPWGCSTATRGASDRGALRMSTLWFVERGVENEEAIDTANSDHWNTASMVMVGKEEVTRFRRSKAVLVVPCLAPSTSAHQIITSLAQVQKSPFHIKCNPISP